MKSKWADRYTVTETLRAKSEDFYSKLMALVLDHNDYSVETKNTINGYIRSGRFDLLLSFADSYGGAVHSTARDHFLANQLTALIKKVPRDLRHLGIDPEAAAYSKFFAAEKRCRRYNKIFRLERKLGYERAHHERDIMRKWIRRVLGETPPYAEIWAECGFGPGASVGVSGNATHLAAKLLAPSWSVTLTALQPSLAALRSHAQMWELLLLKQESARHFSWDPIEFERALRDKVKVVDYNKITLVPKTAKVHRTIAVEPLLNGYLQTGVDNVMRRKLRRFGIDLKDQSRNQEMARQGSLPGEDPYSTIDLESASDSVSLELVKDLLPPDWYYFLCSIRSPNYLLKGEKYAYEKFCSMGNGFCFPLESLIFASVCEAVYERRHKTPDYSVYGDDIIVRGTVAGEVLKLLRLLGFRHNPDKTFLTGPFRESCGADWYLGEDVRPVTMKDIPGSIQEYFSFHNQTLRSPKTIGYFEEARAFLREQLPHKYRFLRPHKGNEDTAFEVPLDLAMSSKYLNWDRHLQSWSWYEMITVAQNDRGISERERYNLALLQAALKGANPEEPFTKRRNTRTRVAIRCYRGGSSTILPPDTEFLYLLRSNAIAVPRV